MSPSVHHRRLSRVWGLGAVFLAVCLFYVIRLGMLELSPDNIGGHKQDGTTERTVIVQAVRGQIYDRNGVPLVTNAYTYSLTMDDSVLPRDTHARNSAILTALKMLESCGEVNKFSRHNFPFDGYYPSYVYSDTAAEAGSGVQKTFLSVMEQNGLRREAVLRLKDAERLDAAAANARYDTDPTAAISCERLVRYFEKEYDLLAVDSAGNRRYSDPDIDRLIRVLWGMEASGFSRANDYVMAEDVSMSTVTHEMELGIAGVGFATSVSRVYNYPGVASHILGVTGPIYAEEWEEYKELGYAMNAIVGKSGCEAAFEAYLHGQDGVKVIVEDKDGNIVREYMKSEAVAGQDVYLTIDIELQLAAEAALAANIQYIRDTFHRSDCNAGAILAMDPNTGAILALASAPTYDLSTYNRDYGTLAADTSLPLVNRALMGVYAPGSTFKPGMVAAALSEGTLTADTLLECAGTYTYYQSYQPDCWIYNSGGSVRMHGHINAVEALAVSCNCFFYETGRRLGIERMNRYCRAMGLGEPTGIELGEYVGSLAGPDDRSATHGPEWQLTDTIAAAIGQSDNAFTPLQLGVYLSTLVTGGDRYAAHLLSRVRDFANRTDTVVASPTLQDSLDIDGAHRATVLAGMEQVVSASTQISYYMRNVPVTVAGKTGTAQVGANAVDNGLFICCAPSQSPEIVVVSVIERAGGGSYSAMSAGELLAAYYEGKNE